MVVTALEVKKGLRNIAKHLEVHRSTVYRVLKKFRYTPETIERDQFAIRAVYACLREDYTFNLAEMLREMFRINANQKLKITRLEQEVAALKDRIMDLTIDPRIFEL